MIRTANQLLRGRPEDRAARAGVTVTTDRRTVTAYVNHGRWVADCPYCNGTERLSHCKVHCCMCRVDPVCKYHGDMDKYIDRMIWAQRDPW